VAGRAAAAVAEINCLVMEVTPSRSHQSQLLPKDRGKRTEALNWLFWQMGATPYVVLISLRAPDVAVSGTPPLIWCQASSSDQAGPC